MTATPAEPLISLGVGDTVVISSPVPFVVRRRGTTWIICAPNAQAVIFGNREIGQLSMTASGSMESTPRN